MSQNLRKRVLLKNKERSFLESSQALKKNELELGLESTYESKKAQSSKNKFLCTYLSPIILTILAFYLRTYAIGSNNSIIWDEAHFAKFGSYYNKHTFYHDVHPPLGKMLCGLSEWLVGFQNPDYKFESGTQYPEDINYTGMRYFQTVFSTLLVPICWATCRALDLSLWSTWLVSLMCCLESAFIVLGKFVLLDSFLFFFTGAVILSLANIHRLRNQEGRSASWKIWMILLGLNIGCVCSIKWVGLFVTSVVGIYTLFDLWSKTWDKTLSWPKYFMCWFRRIVCLIIFPFTLYAIFFKIHLELLYLPGDGSGSMNTLFQANLLNTDIEPQPRFVTLGSKVTLRSQGMNSNLLHSHGHVYPSGSEQYQITTYGFKDDNNIWQLSNSRSGEPLQAFLRDGQTIRLKHVLTGSNLHSHQIPGHVTKNAWEASGYGDETIGDIKDDWIIEVIKQVHSSNKTYAQLHENNETYYNFIHPVSTTFRLKHKFLGCYLGTTGKSYPPWGFQQGEVVCQHAPPLDSLWAKLDTSCHWNIESIQNDLVPIDNDYVYPKSNFITDFIQLQRSMAASNSALTPDPDKFDALASKWWEWPIMTKGIRMSSWGNQRKYYMFGNPFNTWFTSLCLFIYVGIMLKLVYQWRRQSFALKEPQYWKLFMVAIMPSLGYILHYVPFIIMGRVTYYHHYMPALYFAYFITAFVVEYSTQKSPIWLKAFTYLTLYGLIIFFFILFSPLCLGMVGSPANFTYLNWFPSWTISPYIPLRITIKRFVPYMKKQVGKYLKWTI